MYQYIYGRLVDKRPFEAVIDISGVGYFINISSSTFDRLPELSENAKLYIHYRVSEDSQRLYGFYSKEEREVFRSLLGISKIGPRVAISTLSNLSVNELLKIVNTQDVVRLKKVPGLGVKTAQRLIIELKGKLEKLLPESTMDIDSDSNGTQGAFKINSEAESALIFLGYTRPQVKTALERVSQVMDKGRPVEEWIKKALQVI